MNLLSTSTYCNIIPSKTKPNMENTNAIRACNKSTDKSAAALLFSSSVPLNNLLQLFDNEYAAGKENENPIPIKIFAIP